jgi:mono/diheme cytochrome c family protein
MRQFLLGVILAVIVVVIALPLGAILYIRSGNVPVATTAPPFPMERTLAQTALKARIARDAPKSSPVPATPENLMEGAKLYREYCSVCHGVKGAAPSPTALGMNPPPPQLFQKKGVTDDPVGETYWKVSNGIRLTGMPGYGQSLSSTQLWQVCQMLANANRLEPGTEALLAAEPQEK